MRQRLKAHRSRSRSPQTDEEFEEAISAKLAKQTAQTNDDIRKRIEGIKSSTSDAVDSIREITSVNEVDRWDLEIYGTDISPAAVDQARRGVYNEVEINRGLTQQQRGAYFVNSADGWQVNDALRRCCRFETRNLLKPFTGVGKFDIIFCRNVAIYFTPPDRSSLFTRLGATLNKGGCLLTGSGRVAR